MQFAKTMNVQWKDSSPLQEIKLLIIKKKTLWSLKNRALIKSNSDVYASSCEIAQKVADLSMTGNDAWGIGKLTLPITYGRYHNNDLPQTFQRIENKKRSKHPYVYQSLSNSFERSLKRTGYFNSALTSTSISWFPFGRLIKQFPE